MPAMTRSGLCGGQSSSLDAVVVIGRAGVRLTSHREVRTSRRVRIVFDLLAEALLHAGC